MSSFRVMASPKLSRWNTVAELGGVVHRGDFQVGFLRRPQHTPGVVARGRRHEQPPRALIAVCVEHRCEVGGLDSSDPVRLVGDHEVELRHPPEGERVGDLRGGLVGREHHTRSRPPPQERGDLVQGRW